MSVKEMALRQHHFTGLCIGGPDDGKVLGSNSPTVSRHVRKGAPLISPWAGAITKLQSEKFEYVFCEGPIGYGMDGAEFDLNFWVPAGENIAYAFDQLISLYRKTASAKRR